jgi:Flp pilus assembly protein TadG
MSIFRGFGRDQRGTILIEMAIGLPILVTILLGCFEASRYVLLNQKLDRAAASMADLVSQADGITEAQITDLFDAAEQVSEPFDLVGNGRVVVTSVTMPTTTATVAWQRTSPGTMAVTSTIGTPGSNATLPSGLTLRTGENVIAAEVFYQFTPYFLGSVFGEVDLYHSAFFRPRITNLTTVQ